MPASPRVLTIPNVISFIRLACIPWFVYLVFGAEDHISAALLLSVLGATDWIDGYIARRYNQVSAVGKFVDPAADRLLLAVAAVSILMIGAMPLWFGIAMLTREVLVMIGGVVLALRGVRGLEVEYIGKVGAFALMFSFPFFLGRDSVSWNEIATAIAWLCGIPGLIFSWYSAFHYFRRARIILSAETPVNH